jgi:hypothetical protein
MPPPSLAQQKAAAADAWAAYNAQVAAQQAAWSGTTSAASSGGILPSAGEISRALSGATRTAQYKILTTGAIEQAFGNILGVTGLIYCCTGTIAGVLQPTVGTVYLGRSLPHLTEVRAPGEENSPVLISETGRSELQNFSHWVKGTAGDVLILKYR